MVVPNLGSCVLRASNGGNGLGESFRTLLSPFFMQKSWAHDANATRHYPRVHNSRNSLHMFTKKGGQQYIIIIYFTKLNNGIIMVNSEDNHNISQYPIVDNHYFEDYYHNFENHPEIGAGEDIPGTSTTSLR